MTSSNCLMVVIIFQKQFEWFIQMFDLTEDAMRTIPFTNGMRLAG